jgi:hypothetical protein
VAAKASPVYKLAIDWKLALPLHPEYRTLPMVWYVPPLSPIQSAADAGRIGKNGEIPDVKSLRIPVRYLANMLTAGDEAPGGARDGTHAGHARLAPRHARRRRRGSRGAATGRPDPAPGRGDVPLPRHRELRGSLRDSQPHIASTPTTPSANVAAAASPSATVARRRVRQRRCSVAVRRRPTTCHRTGRCRRGKRHETPQADRRSCWTTRMTIIWMPGDELARGGGRSRRSRRIAAPASAPSSINCSPPIRWRRRSAGWTCLIAVGP